MDAIEQLYRSIDSRLTPESVCALILQALEHRLLPTERRLLQRSADTRQAWYTSMSEDFERPVPAVHKVTVLAELLGVDLTRESIDRVAGDPWLLLGEIRTVGMFNGWHPGTDFAARHNRQQRAANGVGLSKRKYNRLVRHLIRTQARALRSQHQTLLRQLTLVGRSGLAYSITVEQMRADVNAACFVAYWVAQKNRRREFTLQGRDHPYDQVCDMLLQRCVRRADATDWWMVARAYPDPAVLARLDDSQRGTLTADWFAFVTLGARMLEDLYATWPSKTVDPPVPAEMWAKRPAFAPPEVTNPPVVKVVDLATMVVRRGVDSSTWNTVAGAYNAARAGWINCLAAAGALELLDAACPGKAMRLIAGDLAALHRMHGGEPDRQTRVWAALPLPWQVLFDGAECDRFLVENAAWAEGVDPYATGWLAPREHADTVAQVKPTPELVHGIEVADPLWAGLLRRAGYFSGKPVKDLADQQAAAGQG